MRPIIWTAKLLNNYSLSNTGILDPSCKALKTSWALSVSFLTEPKSPTFPPDLFGSVWDSIPPLLRAKASGIKSKGPTPWLTEIALARAETVWGALIGLTK